jgi:hypothetical protein
MVGQRKAMSMNAAHPNHIINHQPHMSASGIVTEWYPDEGWGVVVVSSGDSVWFFWNHLRDRNNFLQVLGSGVRVNVLYERADQDGYRFRAVSLHLAG